jgi:hypothetical protein
MTSPADGSSATSQARARARPLLSSTNCSVLLIHSA